MNCIFCHNKMFMEDVGYFICESCPIENAQTYNGENLMSCEFAIKDASREFTLGIALKRYATIVEWGKEKNGSTCELLRLRIDGDFQATPEAAPELLFRLLKQKVFL